jgi:hypothetical protein
MTLAREREKRVDMLELERGAGMLEAGMLA